MTFPVDHTNRPLSVRECTPKDLKSSYAPEEGTIASGGSENEIDLFDNNLSEKS